jgi:hypothetical protein
MCFKFVCESCRLTLPYFCGPPFADALNDIPELCRVNAHTQYSGFKCTNCERLDMVTRHLQSWLRFHPAQSATPGQESTFTSTSTGARERIEPHDPRSPWYFPFVTITNLRKALAASGISHNLIEQRIMVERGRREATPTEAEIEETAAHKKDHCCFCLDNFTGLPQETSPSPTPEQDESATTEETITRNRPRSPRSPRVIKPPRKW